MTVSLKALGIERLDVEERLALIEELWAGIAVDSAAVPLTDAQRAELDRRLVDLAANPEDAVSWDEVKASLEDRLGK